MVTVGGDGDGVVVVGECSPEMSSIENAAAATSAAAAIAGSFTLLGIVIIPRFA